MDKQQEWALLRDDVIVKRGGSPENDGHNVCWLHLCRTWNASSASWAMEHEGFAIKLVDKEDD